MCFSATASFAGAAVIGAAGVAALALVEEKRQIPFAALPLGFGVHQALEGVTWLELDGATDAVLTGWGVHAWVMFAWALLPFYVPWSVRVMEPDPQRRRLLLAPVVIGAALALFMVTQALQPGISVAVVDHNLDYQLGVSIPALVLAVPYVFSTCVGPAMSTYRWVAAFGLANFVAMSAAALIAAQAFSSLWCTFAAFLSLMIVGHFAQERRTPASPTAPLPSEA